MSTFPHTHIYVFKYPIVTRYVPQHKRETKPKTPKEPLEPVRRSGRQLNKAPDYTGETIDRFSELLDKYVYGVARGVMPLHRRLYGPLAKCMLYSVQAVYTTLAGAVTAYYKHEYIWLHVLGASCMCINAECAAVQRVRHPEVRASGRERGGVQGVVARVIARMATDQPGSTVESRAGDRKGKLRLSKCDMVDQTVSSPPPPFPQTHCKLYSRFHTVQESCILDSALLK